MSLEIEAKVGQRGQVVIPKPIRDAYGLTPGMKVKFSLENDKIIIKTSKDALDDYLNEIEKKEEPEKIDWDKKYYTQI